MRKIIANNKKAIFNYHVEQKFEAGLVLLGGEVKSLRQSKVSIAEAYASFQKDELFLMNCSIQDYKFASKKFDNKRPKKLLLHRRELKKLFGATKIKGFTIIPTTIYFNRKGLLKIEIALAKGKTLGDKREIIKERDLKRSAERDFREGNQ